MKEKTVTPSRSVFLAVLVALLVCGTSSLLADYYPPRISHVEGTAAYEPAGEVDWEEVTVNLPLIGGDRIFTHPQARVEIDLGKANFLRLAEETDLGFVQLDEDGTRMELHAGSVILRVNDDERFWFFTPGGTIYVDDEGLYRIDVRQGGLTELAVRKGEAEIENGQGREKLRTGQSIALNTGPQEMTPVAYGYREDAFDLWSDRRDARYLRSPSVQYVGSHYPGVWELDYYGDWVYYPSHGRVWVPRVSVGWVPYRVGSWVHLSFGWTWISHEPWGWLPYHYGRWAYYQNRWCWVPGGFHTWSPARVHFYHGGGYVGWAPWGFGRNTVINNTYIVNNNTVINNNDFGRRGLTVVRETEFNRGVARVQNANFADPGRNVVRSFQEGLPRQLNRPVAQRSRSLAARNSDAPATRSAARSAVSRDSASTSRSSSRIAASRGERSQGSDVGRSVTRRTSSRSVTSSDDRSQSRSVTRSINERESNNRYTVERSRDASSNVTRYRVPAERSSVRSSDATRTRSSESNRYIVTRSPSSRTSEGREVNRYQVGERTPSVTTSGRSTRTAPRSGTYRSRTPQRSERPAPSYRSSGDSSRSISRYRYTTPSRSYRAPSSTGRSDSPSRSRISRPSIDSPRISRPSIGRSSPAPSQLSIRPSYRRSAPSPSRPAIRPSTPSRSSRPAIQRSAPSGPSRSAPARRPNRTRPN